MVYFTVGSIHVIVGTSGVARLGLTTVNESTVKLPQPKSGTHRERVTWKMSPVTPKRSAVAGDEPPGSPFRTRLSTPTTNTFRRLKSQGIRTPPETPMRSTKLEDDSTPQLPLKMKASYLCSPRRFYKSDDGSDAGSPSRKTAHVVSRQHYYKVPPLPRPANFPPLDVECGSCGSDKML